MVRPLNQIKLGNLGLRIASAAVILPVVFAALWFGDWVFAVLLGILGGVMCWEWAEVSGAWSSPEQWMMVVMAAVAPLLMQAGFDVIALILILAGGAVIFLIRMIRNLNYGMFRRALTPVVIGLGLPYIGLTMLAAVSLRADPGTGFMTLVWVVCLVIATDVGAYFTGRGLGGPKLMPFVSPNKTWSGLAGGALCAGLTGLLVGYAVTGAVSPALGGLSVGLGCVAQGGDLIESAFKRRYDVKDTSQLIPGHGGFLDRCDGYLTVMPVTALMALVIGGSPIVWQ